MQLPYWISLKGELVTDEMRSTGSERKRYADKLVTMMIADQMGSRWRRKEASVQKTGMIAYPTKFLRLVVDNALAV